MAIPPFLPIFLGGGVGSACRYFVGNMAGKAFVMDFPYSTLSVNLIGAFLIGLIVEFAALKFTMPDPWRLFLVTGFLGGFTTFSAFSLETALMIQRGAYKEAVLYIFISVAGTIALVLSSTWFIRQIL